MKLISCIFMSCFIFAGYLMNKEHPVEYTHDDKILLSLIISQNIPDSKSIDCHTLNIYHEARGESYEGQYKVFKVVENRMKKRNKSTCDIVWEPNQFSWTIGYNHTTKINQKEYNKIRDRVIMWSYNYDGNSKDITHYHHKNINPYWNHNMKLVANVGNHVFWR